MFGRDWRLSFGELPEPLGYDDDYWDYYDEEQEYGAVE